MLAITKYTETTRHAMQAAGLYKCHVIDEGYWRGFRDYQKDNKKLRVNHYRQTCKNVVRLMYYLNNDKQDISRLADTEEVINNMYIANQEIFKLYNITI